MDDDVAARSDKNMVGSWRVLLDGLGDIVVHQEDDDVLMASTDLPMAFFNPSFLKRPLRTKEAAAVLDRIDAFYEPRHVPFLVWAPVGVQDAFIEQALAAGFRSDSGPPAMVLSPIPQPVPPDPPAGLEIVTARSADLLAATADIVAAGFGLPVDLCHRIVEGGIAEHPAVSVLTGLVQDHPVSTATLIVTDDVAGIYNVATPDPNRGRGFGAALTWAAVAEGARRGCTMASLQASPLGFPVYERMGFRPVA